MSSPALQLRGVTREYVTQAGKLPVLRGVDLDLHGGEIVGLIGPSGSGKSSLLHAAGLLERPNSGQVWIGGKDCSKLSDNGRTKVRLHGVGFVYQFHHLLPELTAQENVALPAQIAGKTRKAAGVRASELLAGLGLAERGHHQPAQLSGGEQQRVALARAFVVQPAVLLADEPTGSLDFATGETVMELMFELNREQGTTLVLVTHDRAIAQRCARCITIEAGRVLNTSVEV